VLFGNAKCLKFIALLNESPFVKMGKNQQKSAKISTMTTFLCFFSI
jgi:hypothetical protein